MSEKANVDLMKGSSGSKACSLCMISLSLIFCALSGVASVWLPKYINDAIVDSGTICDATDDNFEDYTTPENSITENWYFYTWELADALAFTRGTGMAKVKEMGPFTWDKKTYTYDVTFANGEMTYTDATVYVYNVAESDDNVSLDTEIIVESLGYQSLITGALTEGTLGLSGSGCTSEQIAATKDAQAFVAWLGIDFTAADPVTGLPGVPQATSGNDAPNNVCQFITLSGDPGNTNEQAIATLSASDCICCIPAPLEQYYIDALAFGGNDAAAVDAAGLTATFGGSGGALTTFRDVAPTCNSLAGGAKLNNLIDILADDDRALSQPDNEFSTGSYWDDIAAAKSDDKFPITATFHKITVKELAFGYASSMVGFFSVKPGISKTKVALAGSGVDVVDYIVGGSNADFAQLTGIASYSAAVHGACVGSGKCSDAAAIGVLTSFGVPYTTYTTTAELDGVSLAAGGALKGAFFKYSGCDGEISLATLAATGKPHEVFGYLDFDGMSCKAASTGFAVANHYCGMREDWLDGTDFGSGVAGDGAFGTPDPTGAPGVSAVVGTPLETVAAVAGGAAEVKNKRDTRGCKCLKLAADPDPAVPVSSALKYTPYPFNRFPIVVGCCLAAGNNEDLGGDLTGFGCLVPIPGRVPGQRDSLVVARAANRSPKYSTRNTGCEAGEEENAWNQVNYEGKTEYSAYVTGVTVGQVITLTEKKTLPEIDVVTTLTVTQALEDDLEYLPSPYMMNTLITQAPAANVVTSAVNGGNGAQIPPQGLDTRSFGGAHLNDNVAVKDTFILYETNSKIGLSVSNTGASVVKEIPTQRYELKADALHRTGKSGVRTGTNADIGVGFPWNGIVPFAWERAAPVAISQPNFFNGENGGSYKTTADPTGVSGAIDAVEITDTTDTLLTQENIDLDTENYQTYFDVEISTGKTFQVHQRLQLNTFFGACHDSQAECNLVNFKSTTPPLSTNTQLKSIYNVRTPDMKGDVIVPIYRLDRNAAIKDDSADAFKGLEKMMQLADIGSIICLLFGVVLGLFGIVKCMQN